MDLRSLATPILLGLFCFVVYNANLRQIGAGDTWPARYLPLLIWQYGSFDLDMHARLVAHGHSLIAPGNRPVVPGEKVDYFEPPAYWMIRTHQGQLASLYPVVAPLLVAPLYLPAVLWLNAGGWEQPAIDRVAVRMEKISASILASVASVLMYLVLRRDAKRWSLLLAVAFALGTNTWMISSQALWQHGAGQLLIVLALLLAVSAASPTRTALLGAVCVLIAANRPPDGLIAAALVLFVVWSLRRDAVWLLAGAAVPLAAVLYYNLAFVGHIGGGYGLVGPPPDYFHLGLSGVAGLLFSPARGLLVFSPFLVFVPVGLIQRLRSPRSRALAVALSVAVAAQIVMYGQVDWIGGASWGPRYLTDVLPILVWMLAPAPLVFGPLARGLLVLAMAASVVVQGIGAFWYTRTSDELIFAPGSTVMATVWNPSNVPFLVELRHPPAGGDLQCDAVGSLDRVELTPRSGADDVLEVRPGAALEGSALACGRTPAQVLVLIDGIVVGVTGEFQPRPDVSDAMRTTSPSVWRLAANTHGVAPGEHVLQVAVRIEPRSDIRVVHEQRVLVVAPEPPQKAAPLPQGSPAEATPAPQAPASGSELEAMAARAASSLRDHQSGDGFWLTAYTSGSSYDAPRPEMNTFLTSMLVDVVSPIARQPGLDDVVERARRHLASQIEGTGLVRYHGLPNGPTIGTLGCVITPDADDTALAWRIAGPGAADPRQQLMLGELARYRAANGLYRTWLAPQPAYQCIDPGRDPNPTDVAIQMHVYMMLRDLDPPAAQSLCTVLQAAFLGEDIWVYYAEAPLVPYLRAAELSQLGCALPLPTERLERSASGQETWSEAARRLVDVMASPPDANGQQAIRELLVRIGSDDFALLRRSPPLLYHNDLSATVRRFYWSEDFGYAVWLRLYDAVDVKSGRVQ